MTSVDAGSIIRVLPPVVSNQIAAGEVVTRPASVVKELIENALDAGATKVRVEIEAGGTLRIRVTDDGHGMSPADALLCVERHATSKIRSADDLLDIRTLGFRGEALPSIASVSRFLLRTRRAGDEVGCELQIEGGERAASGPCSCAPGTGIEVAELFFNVPARRKFLRGLSTESAHVTEVVAVAALGRPDISFVLLRDGRMAREWLRTPSRPERVAQVLGERELAPCVGERGPLRVEAYLGRPEHARAGAAGLHFFVNDRPVGDRSLARAIAAAYGPALAAGRYPVGAIFLELPRALVDVNVHPQKAEVRFAQARAVSDALCSVVRAEISRMLGLPPRPGLEQGGDALPSSGAWRGSGGAPRFPLTARDAAPSRGMDGPAGASSWVLGESAHGAQPQPQAPPRPSPDRWVGTVRRRWMVLETATSCWWWMPLLPVSRSRARGSRKSSPPVECRAGRCFSRWSALPRPRPAGRSTPTSRRSSGSASSCGWLDPRRLGSTPSRSGSAPFRPRLCSRCSCESSRTCAARSLRRAARSCSGRRPS